MFCTERGEIKIKPKAKNGGLNHLQLQIRDVITRLETRFRYRKSFLAGSEIEIVIMGEFFNSNEMYVIRLEDQAEFETMSVELAESIRNRLLGSTDCLHCTPFLNHKKIS